MSLKSNEQIAKRPLAIAWSEWLAGDEGQSCAAEYTRGILSREYLVNRLNCAFNAGATTAQSELARAVLSEIENVETPSMMTTATKQVVEQRLRDLFTAAGLNSNLLKQRSALKHPR